MHIEPVAAVQRCYPRIYQACHVDHVRRVSSPYRLSAKDSAFLAHLDVKRSVTTGRLARHLGVAASTLSAAAGRLESLGYIARTPKERDRRTIQIRLTELGARAMSATSVLDHQRVAAMLGRLASSERRRAVKGLELLAKAADALQADAPRRPDFSP